MFSKPFMKKPDKLRILLDSRSINGMPALNRRSKAFFNACACRELKRLKVSYET